MLEVLFGTTKRGNRKYWFFTSQLDDCNMLYPIDMRLRECKEDYAKHHSLSVDSLNFIDLD